MPTQFPVTLFGPTVITCDKVPKSGTSLTLIACRIVFVGPLKPYEQKEQKEWSKSRSRSLAASTVSSNGGAAFFFSFAVVDSTGVADGICWDGDRHPHFANGVGSVVKLTGMTSKPMTSKDVRFARSLNENMLHCNRGPFTFDALAPDHNDFSGIPLDGNLPAEWLNSRERIERVLSSHFGVSLSDGSQVGHLGGTGSQFIWQGQQQTAPTFSGGPSNEKLRQQLRNAIAEGTAATSPSPAQPQQSAHPCCTNPQGLRCRKTGQMHPPRCIVCGCWILPGENFCSDPSNPGPCIPVPPPAPAQKRTREEKDEMDPETPEKPFKKD